MGAQTQKSNCSVGKILLSLLAASAFPLTVSVFGPYEIFSNNRAEFSFAMADFMPYLLVGAILFALLVGAVLVSLRGRAYLVGLSVVLFFSLMPFLQGMFLNFGITTLASDGLEQAPSVFLGVINLLIWIGVLTGLLFASVKIKDQSLFTSLCAIAFSMIIGVQALNMGIYALSGGETSAVIDPEDDSYKSINAVLTDEGMFEVSAKENVIVIVLDRFDVSYYKQLVKADADFFAPLDGFTYYDNNISMYSRTYPSITYMLTGVEQNFEDDAETYFEKAYRGSAFFADLMRNGYGIRLYTESYYAYRNANVLLGIAENVMSYKDYKITDRAGLCGNMLALSAYRYLPIVLKSQITVSSGDFADFIAYDGDLPRYMTDDAATYERFREQGVTVREDGKNQFTFIHLNGCHNPFTMDENGNRVENGEALPAIRGVFSMIFSYFEQLKQAGVYDDATIIITGDHASAITDKRDLEGVRVTALFVKESGASGTPLAYSSAPVSQANLRAEIVKSAEISTENDYGIAISDIAEDASAVRKYCFAKTLEDGTHQIVEYRVTGDANRFESWEVVERRNIGKLYK